jgi:hypothetical protein
VANQPDDRPPAYGTVVTVTFLLWLLFYLLTGAER